MRARLSWMAVASVAVVSLASAQENVDLEALSRLEAVWNEAHLEGDAAALDALWADDLVVTVPKMPAMTKAEVLRFTRSGRMRFDRYETSDVAIHLHGDAAIVTGRLHRLRHLDGQAVEDDWLFTKSYQRRGDRWQVVAFHASEAPPPS